MSGEKCVHGTYRDYCQLCQQADDYEQELATLRAELEAARADSKADRERLDWLEGEMYAEQAAIASGKALPPMLFRRNYPITRSSIDAAIRKARLGEG